MPWQLLAKINCSLYKTLVAIQLQTLSSGDVLNIIKRPLSCFSTFRRKLCIDLRRIFVTASLFQSLSLTNTLCRDRFVSIILTHQHLMSGPVCFNHSHSPTSYVGTSLFQSLSLTNTLCRDQFVSITLTHQHLMSGPVCFNHSHSPTPYVGTSLF